jgi:hypothetical protein
MNSELECVFAEGPPAVVLGKLEETTLGDEDIPRAAILLEQEHYLGAARPLGRTLFGRVWLFIGIAVVQAGRPCRTPKP